MKLGQNKNLIGEYKNLVLTAVSETECKGKLNSKLKVIIKAAGYDGIGEKDIGKLIEEVTPPDIVQSLWAS